MIPTMERQNKNEMETGVYMRIYIYIEGICGDIW